MNLQEYFYKIHEEISQEVGLSPSQVCSLRVMLLSEKKTINDVKEFLIKKMRTKRLPGSAKRKHMRESGTWKGYAGYRTKPRKYYQHVLDFLSSCSEEQMKIVLKEVPKFENKEKETL